MARAPAMLFSDAELVAACKALGLASRLTAAASARSLRQKRLSCLQSLRVAYQPGYALGSPVDLQAREIQPRDTV